MSSQEGQLTSFLNGDSLNEDFFADVVENSLNISRNSFKVKFVFLSPATGNNDSYISQVLRAKIKIQLIETNKNEIVDVIIKANLAAMEELSELSVFQREQFVYEDLIKNFEDVWLKAGCKVKFGPRGLKFEAIPNEIIVMDDLNADDYLMLDRKQGLNVEQAELFLKKLAKFHAAGAVRFQKDGVVKDFLDRNSPSSTKPDIKNPDPLTAVFIRVIDEFEKGLRSYGGCDHYADKVAKWNKFVSASVTFTESSPMKCGFQVLNHGDIWVNNIMYRFSTNDVLMIDFQLSFWGSPAYDVILLLMLSIHDDVKVTHFDHLVEFYHRELTECLRKLDYEWHIPSLEEFYEDINEKGHVAASILTYLFFAKYDSKVEFTLETLMREKDEAVLKRIFDAIFNDDNIVKATKIWLPFMDERGFLDALINK